MEINTKTYLWDYLSQGQKDLILEGEYLMDKVIKENKYSFKDYSFLVFPFAKAYEGFLKKILLDVKFISRLDYISNHFRIGKVLSPNLVQKLGERSVYRKISETAGTDLADDIWNAWKMGRNQVFHYFPHNLQSLTFQEAESIVKHLLKIMEQTVLRLKVEDVKTRLQLLS
jgi:hypothetical protein